MTFLLTVRNDMGPDPVQQGEAMKHYSAVCFDFDYTLGDSTDSIVAGFQYGFERLGHPIPDRETVRGTIGYLLEDAYTMLAGDRDPVGANGAGVKKVAGWFRDAGVKDLTVRLYPEGRHEMLNEANRDEVYRDVLSWLERRLPA